MENHQFKNQSLAVIPMTIKMHVRNAKSDAVNHDPPQIRMEPHTVMIKSPAKGSGPHLRAIGGIRKASANNKNFKGLELKYLRI